MRLTWLSSEILRYIVKWQAAMLTGSCLLLLCTGAMASGNQAVDSPVSGSGAYTQFALADYEIVISASALDGVREAAKELQRVIEKSSGSRLPIVFRRSVGKRALVVGVHPLAIARGITADGLPLDGYRLRIVDGDVFLVGRDDSTLPFYVINKNQSASAGSYFAMIDFLRRFFGVEWYMPGPLGEEIPQSQGLRLPVSFQLEDKPRFQIRFIDVVQTATKDTAERLYQRGDVSAVYFDEATARDASRWGRHLRIGNNFEIDTQHAWYLWMPAESPSGYSSRFYGKTHPEYFAVPGGRDGKYYYGSDNAHGGQLCLSNPDVAVEMAANILAYGRRTGRRAFSLSPNDGDFDCAASCCGGIAAAAFGSRRDLISEVLPFSNRIAELVTSKMPDARFGLYASGPLLDLPPSTPLHPSIDISDVYNGLPYIFNIPGERARVEQLIRKWRARGGRVTLTTYYTHEGHYSLPWSTVDTLAWLVGMLKDSPESAGIYMNFSQFDAPAIGAVGPDVWVLSELLWNPQQSAENLAGKYFLGAFGSEAGSKIRACYSEINTAMAVAVGALPYREMNGVKDYILPAYGRVRERCHALIEAATKDVQTADDRFKWRVDRVARAWRLAELTVDMLAAERDGDTKRTLVARAARRDLLASPNSRFALAPVAADFMEHLVPLVAEPQ